MSTDPERDASKGEKKTPEPRDSLGLLHKPMNKDELRLIDRLVGKTADKIAVEAKAVAKQEKQEMPTPDFSTSMVVLGPMILADAYRLRSQMFQQLAEGDVQGAVDTAVNITLCFPTAELRKWLTSGVNLREELARRFKDFVGYSFERMMPSLGITNAWYFNTRWAPDAENEKREYEGLREVLIAREYLEEEFGARTIDTLNLISAFVPTEKRLSPEELTSIGEQIEKPQEEE